MNETQGTQTLRYKIVFATSADRYSAQHRYIRVAASALGQEIVNLQAKGRIIVEVSRVQS
jgi:hypothetical protein